MDEAFELPVNFNNKQLHFPARLMTYGYSFKLEIDIEETKVFFERDEERNWRALVSFEDVQTNKNVNASLLKAIAESIEEIFK